PFEYTLPWSNITPLNKKKNHQKSARDENKLFGHNSDESIILPGVSNKRIEIDCARLANLYMSIKKQGFVVKYEGAMNGFVLMKGDEWKWVLESGQHRGAV